MTRENRRRGAAVVVAASLCNLLGLLTASASMVACASTSRIVKVTYDVAKSPPEVTIVSDDQSLPTKGPAFVDGAANVSVAIVGGSPLCHSYQASIGTVAYAPPAPLPGAVWGVPPPSGTSHAPPSQPPPDKTGFDALMKAPDLPKTDSVAAIRKEIIEARALLKSTGREYLPALQGTIINTAAQIQTLNDDCHGQGDPRAAADQLESAKKDLTKALAQVDQSLQQAGTLLALAPAIIKAIREKFVEERPPDKAASDARQSWLAVCDALTDEVGALAGAQQALTVQRDALYHGTNVESVTTLLPKLDKIQADNKRANRKADPDTGAIIKEAAIDTNQTVTIDITDANTNGKSGLPQVSFHTLSPLYVDVGIGPAYIFETSRTWSVTSAPGSTLGNVTESDSLNIDGVVALSAYVWGPRYYDGSLKHAPKQWAPRPVLGLSLKSAFSSVYTGIQIDPIQFVDISFGAYFYSRPELAGVTNGQVVPAGSAPTANALGVAPFIALTSSVNLFATWLSGVAKSPPN